MMMGYFMFNVSGSAAQQYHRNNSYSAVDASPHKLISLLMNGILDRLAKAKGHSERNEFEQRSRHIGKATEMIDCLSESLDHKYDKQMTRDLEQLYDYMTFRLFSANTENSPEMIDEVYMLLHGIYTAWQEIE